MTRLLPMAVLLLSAASAARAQEPAPVYQATEQYSFQLRADGVFQDEWTRDIFEAPGRERWRAQLRPRVEMAAKWLLVGVGGEFGYSEDDNTQPPSGATTLALLRDNYRAREARLDLAFASLKPASWLRLEGGRFPFPLGPTEMIWDRDLRPQGAAVHLGESRRLGLSALGARGSHVFDDEGVELLAFSATLRLPSGTRPRFELTGSYLDFRRLDGLEPMIRRQNTRRAPGGLLALDYDVVDVVARLRHEGALPWQLVADVAWNRAAERDRRGLWLAAAVGSTLSARARAEYTYARVDRDATVAAYAGDDFFWGTGWEGHRGDLGIRLGERATTHLVAQRQRFKDSARPEERGHWVKRYRVELKFR